MKTHAPSPRATSVRLLALGLMLCVYGVGLASAQTETGQITGTITDPDGAVVARASIAARSIATGVARETTSTGAGVYTLPNLQPGVYEVTVEAPGFAPFVAQVEVAPGARTGHDVGLTVAGASGEVDVVAGDVAIRPNTEDQQISMTLSETEVREFPNLDRSVYSLARLAPNVTQEVGAEIGAGERGLGVAINGQRAAGTNVLLDGTNANNEFTATPGQAVPLDAIGQVNIVTTNFSAEFGRASGGIFNVASRSGTSEVHGSLYEFNRTSALGSVDFDTNATFGGRGEEVPKPPYVKNQFGGSVGGPLWSDRVLGFANLEWSRTRGLRTVDFWVPTTELIAASSPETQAYYAGQEPSSTVVHEVLTVGDIATRFPLGPGPFADLSPDLPAFQRIFVEDHVDVGAGTPANRFLMLARVDWNVSDDTSVYGRVAVEDSKYFKGLLLVPYKGYDAPLLDSNTNTLVSVTHAFSKRFVAQTKFAVSRLHQSLPTGEQPVRARIGQSGWFGFQLLGLETSFGFPGYYGGPVPVGPQTIYEIGADAHYTFGRHQLRFGGAYTRNHDDRTLLYGEAGLQQLANGVNFNLALNNFVLGRAVRFSGNVDLAGHVPPGQIEFPLSSPSFTRNNRYNEYALYVTDAWNLMETLTVNLGVRYEYFGVQHNTDRSLDSNFYLGDGASVPEQIRNGDVVTSDRSPVGGLYRPDRNNFGPKVGVAWDVFGDGKTALRGGYGISYERNFGNVTYNVVFNPPAFGTADVSASQLGLPFFPLSTDHLGPFSESGTIPTLPVTVRAIDPDLRTAYAHSWSVSAERQLFGTTLVAVDYAGSRGVDLYTLSDVNKAFSGAVYLGSPEPFVDPENFEARLNGQFGSINLRGNGAESIHHAMSVRVVTRDLETTGLLLNANYTWGHTIDTLSTTFSEGELFIGFTDPFEARLDRGSADYDQRHRLAVSGIWEVPFARDTEGWQRHVLDGWSMSFIYTARTGWPFNIYDCSGANFSICPRVSLTAEIPRSGSDDPPESDLGPNVFEYIDLRPLIESGSVGYYQNPQTSAYVQAWFEDPSLHNSDYGPFPDNIAGRNIFRGPGAWYFDATIQKRFEITKTTNLTIRAEFYNLFNHANLFPIETDIANPFVPFVEATRFGRRVIQIGARLSF